MSQNGESVKVVRPIPENVKHALGELRTAIANPDRRKELEAEKLAFDREIDALKERIDQLREKRGEIEAKLEKYDEADQRLTEIQDSLEEA